MCLQGWRRHGRSVVTLNASSSYGQTNAAVNVAGSAGTAQGVVELLDARHVADADDVGGRIGDVCSADAFRRGRNR